MKKLYCIITETLTKEDITNDLLNIEFNFSYGGATGVAPHVIEDTKDTYKVSYTVTGNEARYYYNKVLDGEYEIMDYGVTFPD